MTMIFLSGKSVAKSECSTGKSSSLE